MYSFKGKYDIFHLLELWWPCILCLWFQLIACGLRVSLGTNLILCKLGIQGKSQGLRENVRIVNKYIKQGYGIV